MDTFLEHSKNTNVIPDFPSGKPAKKHKDRVSFIGDVLEAIEVHDVAKMEAFLAECSVLDTFGQEAYPLMAKRPRKALG